MRYLFLFAITTSLAMPALAALDAKVPGLNATTHAALKSVKKRNPGSLTERDATELKTAIMADGKVDDAERDLLEEMTQSQFRNITVTLAGSNPPDNVRTFTTAGNAKRVLLETLNPPADLGKEWDNGLPGWRTIVLEYKKPEKEATVLNFVAGKISEKWAQSNQHNGYKPLRDEIVKRYGFSNSLGADTNLGRALLYKACNQVDRNAGDAMPDFLYNWVRPGGFL